MSTQKQISIKDISGLDIRVRELIGLYSSTRIRIGLELAKTLTEIEKYKLYSRLDEKAYPTFNKYIESLGINYRTARDIISLYETYVLTAGYTIEELAQIPYTKLSSLKPYLFTKRDNKYLLTKPIEDVRKWVQEAGSDISIEDLKQKAREEKVGEHEHEFQIIKLRLCRICKLKERF